MSYSKEQGKNGFNNPIFRMLVASLIAGSFVLQRGRVTASAFLASAFASWEIHDLKRSWGVRISVPSRGFCFWEIHDLKRS